MKDDSQEKCKRWLKAGIIYLVFQLITMNFLPALDAYSKTLKDWILLAFIVPDVVMFAIIILALAIPIRYS
jgi:hypothetical protein